MAESDQRGGGGSINSIACEQSPQSCRDQAIIPGARTMLYTHGLLPPLAPQANPSNVKKTTNCSQVANCRQVLFAQPIYASLI